MDATETLLFGKLYVVSESGNGDAAALAAFEADADIVEDLLLSINDRRGHAVIAHEIDGFMQPLDIVGMHDDAQVVEAFVA